MGAMSRIHHLLALFGLSLWMTSQLCRAAEPAPPKADYTIVWQGSAFEKGDAFTASATIFKSKVNIHWKGYKGNRFDYMSEKKKEMIEKSFTLSDEASVQAFLNVAKYCELCDDGDNGYIGQGVSTDVSVKDKSGKVTQSLYYFFIEDNEPLAEMMSYIPMNIKASIGDGKARMNPKILRTSIQKLSKAIMHYQDMAQLLSSAYQKNRTLPAKKLAAFLQNPPLNTIIQKHRSPKETKALANEAQAILRCCLTNGSWKAFTGQQPTPQAILIELKGISRSSDWGDSSLLPFQMSFNDTHLPATVISQDGRDLLLAFIIGKRYVASKLLERVRDLYSLGVDNHGQLTIIARSRRSFSEKKTDLSFLKDPDVQARLRYLNQKGIIDIIFPHRDKTAKAPPVTLTLETITISEKNQNHAKISFFEGTNWKVLSVHKVDNKWQVGRTWDWHKYHSVKDAFTSGEVFRDKEGKIIK